MHWVQHQKILFPSLFIRSDATNVRSWVSKVSKKCKKADSELILNRQILLVNQHRGCFFLIPKNRYFKVPVDSSAWLPPYLSPAKNNYFLNRTNKQKEQISQSGLECEHGRKRRFAQKAANTRRICIVFLTENHNKLQSATDVGIRASPP